MSISNIQVVDPSKGGEDTTLVSATLSRLNIDVTTENSSNLTNNRFYSNTASSLENTWDSNNIVTQGNGTPATVLASAVTPNMVI